MKQIKLWYRTPKEENSKKRFSLYINEQVSLLLAFTFSIIFIFLIGITIPLMESRYAYFMAIDLIPVVIMINYIFIKITLKSQKARNQRDGLEKFEKRLNITIDNKRYVFLKRRILLYYISLPTFLLLFIFYLDLEINDWLGEIVAKQALFILNDMFNVGASAIYIPGNPSPWYLLKDTNIYRIDPGCVGAQVWGLIAGLTVFAPSSEFEKKEDYIVWRKTKYIITAVILGHAANIIRLFLQVYITYLGFDAFVVHRQIADITAVLAAILILVYLLYKWVPEVFISVFYTLKLGYTMILKIFQFPEVMDDKAKESKKYTWQFSCCILIFLVLVIIAIFYVFV
ncbi:MAG: hypothetical protein ACFFAT_16220 [Promethearchaeota archaeon]